MEVVITGGTGLVGKALTKALLDKGYNVCILSRKPAGPSSVNNLRYSHWDPGKGKIDAEVIRSAQHVINLAGAGIADKRWSKKYKQQILISRVLAGNLLTDTINRYAVNLKSVVSASAIGWYGNDRADHVFSENDPPATDFLGEVCTQWEQSLQPLSCPVAMLRTGIVLSNNGGAYPKLIQPVHLGIAAIIGNGKQVMSWIHLYDLVRLYIMAMENSWSGSFNAVSPMPVTNRYLVLESAKKIKERFFIPVHIPAFILKIVIGGSSEEVLKSCTVSCEKVQSLGFTFRYPSFASCMDDLTSSQIVS